MIHEIPRKPPQGGFLVAMASNSSHHIPMHNLPTHRSEILGGLALLLAALAALLIVNLGGGHAYHHLLEAPLTLGLEPLSLTKSLHHWINDGLMALFSGLGLGRGNRLLGVFG
ncbi:MAG: hypothetical protein EBR79_04365, partial [Proteobacteria bacterium]|nr:hypothetical protein [Pseudomonadota bacterium]